ncbi:MAG TPA: hypothetical protein PK379_09870 [Candidatus Hydrogenedentes bacterium]|nr:hypothetical protein [Candidatus Hydrogenedentota bacterium]HOJ69145.1 hypothetical protein [Candidatus Hydrogenedentota bacterium]HOK90321.1 hypothetical protein [Candidatus Hydrogenedentota bacterium]HOV60861.1 hypothetical protein [Candidatus Hydrogenedentota bacterium]
MNEIARENGIGSSWSTLRARLLREFQEDLPPDTTGPEAPGRYGVARLAGGAFVGMVVALALLWAMFRLIPGGLTVNATSSLLHKEARAARGSLLHEVASRRFEEALAIGFRQASQVRSVRQEYIQSLVESGQRDRALEILKPLADGGQAGVYELLAYAELLLESGKADEALKWARETVPRAEQEKNPAVRAVALGVEGGALLALGNLEDARKRLNDSVKARPTSDAAVYLARLLWQEGNARAARSLLEKYLAAGGERLTAAARALHQEIITKEVNAR